MSDMTLSAVLKRMKRDGVTVHGFRSTFRDWAAEKTTFSGENEEICLAAALGVSQATLYRRVNAGLIPEPVHFGGTTRWPASDIRQVIESLKGERDARQPGPEAVEAG